jgi:hypothetical protein
VLTLRDIKASCEEIAQSWATSDALAPAAPASSSAIWEGKGVEIGDDSDGLNLRQRSRPPRKIRHLERVH